MSRERWQELDEKATPGPWAARNLGRHDASAVVRYDGDSPAGLLPVGPLLADVGGYSRAAVDARFIAAARTAWPAAERERDQLRADNNRWREQGIAWVDQHLALAHENDQLRAERDQALALLRQVKELAIDCEPIQIRLLLTASGLLDDEGQQR